MSRRHRARGGWFRPLRGRPDQPLGRHTPQYLEHVAPDIGLHPMGSAGRVNGETQTHVDDDRENGNDPHIRIREDQP